MRYSASKSIFATILAGKSQKRFTVHKSLISHHLELFHAALTGRLKEAQDKTVTLQDDEVAIFEFFLHWLYYQRFLSGAAGMEHCVIRSLSQ
jgi:hypothetical protein